MPKPAALVRRTFRSLHGRNYRLYLAGSSVSVSGTWMQRTAQDWLVLQLSDSGVALGIATALQFAPILFTGLWGGLIVDRVNRRRLVIATQVAQLVLAAGLGVLTVSGAVTLWMVYALALALGCVTVFDSPGRQALVAELVPVDQIANAQALYSSVHNAGRLVGPAVAGVVIATLGVGAAFLINAASFVAVLACLLAIDVAALHRLPPVGRSPAQVREGLRFVWHRPEMWLSLVLVGVVGVFGQNFRVILPLLAQDTLDGDAQTYGYLTAALGLGAIVGSLVTATIGHSSAWWLVLSCAGFGIVNLLDAAVPNFAFAIAGVAALGVTTLVFNTQGRTLLLISSDQAMQGRVMALYSLVFLGSRPIGAPLVGWICSATSARAGFVVAGATALAAAVVLMPTVRRLREPAVTQAGSAGRPPTPVTAPLEPP